MRSLEQNIRNIQVIGRNKTVSYKDLCMFLYVHLKLCFKTPNFYKYEGHADSLAHLKRFGNRIRGSGGLKRRYLWLTLVRA